MAALESKASKASKSAASEQQVVVLERELDRVRGVVEGMECARMQEEDMLSQNMELGALESEIQQVRFCCGTEACGRRGGGGGLGGGSKSGEVQ